MAAALLATDHALEHRGHSLGRLDGRREDLLMTGGPLELEAEGRKASGHRVIDAGVHLRIEGPVGEIRARAGLGGIACEAGAAVGALVDREGARLGDGIAARPGGELGADVVGAAGVRRRQNPSATALEVQVEIAERLLGVVVEDGPDLARVGVALEVARELDRHPLSLGDHVAGEQGVEGVVVLLGDVEVALQRVVEDRGLDLDRADLGVVGAVGVVGIEVDRGLVR